MLCRTDKRRPPCRHCTKGLYCQVRRALVHFAQPLYGLFSFCKKIQAVFRFTVMPIYEYQCQECQAVFEDWQSGFEDREMECPECGGPSKRLISHSSFHLKGSGWYADGYGGKKSGSTQGEAAPPATKNSNCPAAKDTSGSAENSPAPKKSLRIHHPLAPHLDSMGKGSFGCLFLYSENCYTLAANTPSAKREKTCLNDIPDLP